MKLVVRSVLHEFSLEVERNTRARELFDLIGKSLGIHEIWWFGLLYHNDENQIVWLEQSKKVSAYLDKIIQLFLYSISYK